MQTVSIEIDPHDFLDGHDVAKQIMTDALEMLASGRADAAASILSNALGKKPAQVMTDPEEDRRFLMEKIFKEWMNLAPTERGAFWEWSHGRRKCS